MAGKDFPLSLIIRAIDKATAPLQRITGKIGGMSAAATKAGKTLSVGLTLPLVRDNFFFLPRGDVYRAPGVVLLGNVGVGTRFR